MEQKNKRGKEIRILRMQQGEQVAQRKRLRPDTGGPGNLGGVGGQESRKDDLGKWEEGKARGQNSQRKKGRNIEMRREIIQPRVVQKRKRSEQGNKEGRPEGRGRKGDRRGQAKTGRKGGSRRRGMHGRFNEPLCLSHSPEAC